MSTSTQSNPRSHSIKLTDKKKIELCDEEKKSQIVQIFLHLFSQIGNGYCTIDQLNQLYSIKGNREGSIQTGIALWNNIAVKNHIGKHEKHLDGCIKKGDHRICKKKVDDTSVYWLRWDVSQYKKKPPASGGRTTQQPQKITTFSLENLPNLSPVLDFVEYIPEERRFCTVECQTDISISTFTHWDGTIFKPDPAPVQLDFETTKNFQIDVDEQNGPGDGGNLSMETLQHFAMKPQVEMNFLIPTTMNTTETTDTNMLEDFFNNTETFSSFPATFPITYPPTNTQSFHPGFIDRNILDDTMSFLNDQRDILEEFQDVEDILASVF